MSVGQRGKERRRELSGNASHSDSRVALARAKRFANLSVGER